MMGESLHNLDGVGFFTGEIPGYGYIDSNNISEVIDLIMSKTPKLDVFKLLQSDGVVYQKNPQGFVEKLIQDIAIAVTSISKTKEEQKAFSKRKSLKMIS